MTITVTGSIGSTPVVIPFTSQGNYQLAFGAVGYISGLPTVGSGSFTLTTPTVAGNYSAPGGSTTDSGVYVTVPGYTAVTLPSNNTVLIVSDPPDGGAAGANTVSAIGMDNSTTVIGGLGSSVVFYNKNTTSVPSQIFFGGGKNYFNEGTNASAVVNVDGTGNSPVVTTTGAAFGGAYIDASQGSTTVRLFGNANVNVVTGGSDSIQAQAGTELLALTTLPSSSTVPAVISETAGANLFLINDSSAFINPGAGNLVILPGSTGSATVLGGTGNVTVFGGIGDYQGGTGSGKNILIGSSVAGSAASLTGASTGGNIIGFGSGVDTATGYDYTTGAGANANLFFQASAGGIDTITDFLPGQDVFSLTLSSSFEATKVTINPAGIVSDGAGGTKVTLTDGSTIDFLKVTVTNSNFT